MAGQGVFGTVFGPQSDRFGPRFGPRNRPGNRPGTGLETGSRAPDPGQSGPMVSVLACFPPRTLTIRNCRNPEVPGGIPFRTPLKKGHFSTTRLQPSGQWYPAQIRLGQAKTARSRMARGTPFEALLGLLDQGFAQGTLTSGIEKMYIFWGDPAGALAPAPVFRMVR